MTQRPTPQRDTTLAIVREVRNILLDAANSRSYLRRGELVSKADERLERVERVLRNAPEK